MLVVLSFYYDLGSFLKILATELLQQLSCYKQFNFIKTYQEKCNFSLSHLSAHTHTPPPSAAQASFPAYGISFFLKLLTHFIFLISLKLVTTDFFSQVYISCLIVQKYQLYFIHCVCTVYGIFLFFFFFNNLQFIWKT